VPKTDRLRADVGFLRRGQQLSPPARGSQAALQALLQQGSGPLKDFYCILQAPGGLGAFQQGALPKMNWRYWRS